MTHIQINGRTRRISILIYVVLMLLSSCSSFNKQLYSGNVYLDVYSYYINDSIDFSVKLAGDHIQNKDLKKLKRQIKTYDNTPFKNNFLEFFETNSTPEYDVFLLYFKNNADLKFYFSYKNFESVNYSNDLKQIELSDSTKYVYGKAKMNIDSAYVLLLAYSRDQNNSDYQLLIEEFSDPLYTSDFTNEYRSILSQPFEKGFDNSVNFDKSINYLRPIVQLKRHANMYRKDDFQFIQAICTYSSRVSNSTVFDDFFEKYRDKTLYTKIPNDGYLAKNESAIKKILSLSSNAKLVLFNENHFNVKHRKLVRLLLKEYYELGYRYLGLEALTEDSLINEIGYPTINSGFYTNEPEMGSLIREAINLGFHVFGYDRFGKNRELNQAKKIVKNTFEKDSEAKVVILGGFDHILEKEDKDAKKWMASYFQELYGINPVTFSQTILKPNKSSWLGIAKNDSISPKSVDYLISNNLSDSVFINQKEKEFSIELPESKFNTEYILSIYIKNEYLEDKDCIPIKNLIISNSEDKVKANLKKESYIYTVKNEKGNLIAKGGFINE